MSTKVYRDFGALNSMSAPENEFNLKHYRQVYQATHEGESRLPFMYRSFISFSYGGKNIEDFDLIATTSGDRLERDAYASFDDLTTTYDTIQGQFFWGSYFKSNSITFDLATDGITQDKLDEFKHWFKPGVIKELILAEHPNRAIMARVSSPPQLKLLPFEHPVTIEIGENSYSTKTTIYRGEIILEMTMDEPFWYAIKNILGTPNVTEGYYDEQWIDANNNKVDVKNTPDALKIIYEDRIPLGSAAKTSVFLGGDMYAYFRDKEFSLIVNNITEQEYTKGKGNEDPDVQEAYFDNGTEINLNGEINFPNPDSPSEGFQYYCGAVIAELDADTQEYIGARIAGAEISTSGENMYGIPLAKLAPANLYYAGTAPAPVTLYFQLTPIIDNETYYITSPCNKFSDSEVPYNTIKLVSTREHNFSFTLPEIYSSYNQVIQLIDSLIRVNGAWLTIREYIRNNIKHAAVRAWANRILDKYDNAEGTGIIDGDVATIKEEIKDGMTYLFKDSAGDILPAAFKFDSRTGKSRGTFTYRVATTDVGSSEWINYASENLTTTEEDIGDMVKSNYLLLDERNVLDSKYQIRSWDENPQYAYKVSHDVSNGLQSLRFEFKNMYL